MCLSPANFAPTAYSRRGFRTAGMLALVLCLYFSETSSAQPSPLASPPPTPKRPVSDTYHGVTITEDYRWLENGEDPEVKQWSDAQNQRTRAYLDKLPARAAIEDYLGGLMIGTSGRYSDLQYRSGRLFARKLQSPKQQPILVVLDSPDDPASEHVVFDPESIPGTGSTSIDYYRPSFDGKLLAVSLSQGGTEKGTLHVFEVDTGKELPDRVPGANGPTALGDAAWKADNSGFFYSRYPQGNERPEKDLNFYQQVYFHKLGSNSAQDAYVIGKEFPRIAEIQFESSPDGRFLLAAVANGDGGQFSHYLMDPGGRWRRITRFDDAVVSARLGADNALYLLSRKDAPRGRVLRLPLSTPQLSKAKVIVKQTRGPAMSSDESSRASIDSFVVTPQRLYVTDVAGGPSRVRIFDHLGRQLGQLPLEENSSAGPMIRLKNDEVIFQSSSWIRPPAWFRFSPGIKKPERTALFISAAAKFEDAETVREFATSKDGTGIPLSIVRKKGTKLDGSNPVLMEGYGGYGISMTPKFLGAFARIWLDQGGIFVMTHLRGGGEYGEEWHSAGKLTRKQNVFDDFVACAEHLIEREYTTPEHLAIVGGSNGGLLMGAALTQRPELFRAVVSYVGIYDLLRSELEPNGAFNVTEYGSVKDAEQFKALFAYSPYHHVKDGTRYPAVLFSSAANDGRVNPYQSRKMTARLQAASSAENPILLKTTEGAGHSMGGLKQNIEEYTDLFTFLFGQLGVKYQAPAGSRSQMQ